MMNEKPILFSGEMVRAIQEGRKTQTRRIVKPQPILNGAFWTFAGGGWSDGVKRIKPLMPYHSIANRCPYGQSGDRLWVRETWALICDDWPCQCETDEFHHYEYRADTNDPYPGQWPPEEAKGNPEAPKWRPSIFMPRKASRITLEVVDVWIEQLQKISYEDAIAEGIQHEYPRAWEQFRELWDSINAKRGYGMDINPWVWVVEFKPA